MLTIEKHGSVLSRLGLDTVERFKRFEAEVIQPGKSRREVLRIRTADESGRELVLFLKRNWRSYKKDGLASLLRRGEVWSLARQEWENSKAVQRAGLNTAVLVAYAEDCGPCWEKFSCLLTEAATGSQNLERRSFAIAVGYAAASAVLRQTAACREYFARSAVWIHTCRYYFNCHGAHGC